jgi:hypothetical protein
MTDVFPRRGILIGAFFALYLFFGIQSAHAALLYFDPAEVNVHRGDSITLRLRIDTDEGECINTVNALIHYDPSVQIVDVSRGDSILNIWVENPVISQENHTVAFAGGLPGGYCGRIQGDPSLTNVLLDIVLRSPGFSIGAGDSPFAKIWIDESSEVLLHDGFGTNANLRLQDARINLLDTAGATPTDEWNASVRDDNELPSDFTITPPQKDEFAFGGKFFIVFNSIDKQSGIDHYEVMEEPFSEFYAFRWGRADAPWVETESPYVLTDQTLNSTIRVKAIDKAGNERIAVLVPDVALRSLSRDKMIAIILVGGFVLLIGGLTVFALWKRKQRLMNEIKNIHE